MSIYDWSSGYFQLTNPTGALGGTGGRIQSTLPTVDFKLETANKANIGLDAVLLNSLSLTFDAYYQRRNNIIVYEGGLYSSMAGVGAGYGNQGVVDSKGLEFGLNYNKCIGGLKVDLGGMITYGINKVIDYVETPVPYPWLQAVGYPVDQQRGLQHIGFFNNAQDIASNPKQEFSLTRPGDAMYKLQDKAEGDDSVNDYDRVPIGYSTVLPHINYAFNGGLEFKGIGGNILFQGAARYNRWDDQWSFVGLLPLVQSRNIPMEYYENRWVAGMDNTNAKYPALSTSANPNNETASTLWLKDAAFLKLRHVELYYRFPESMLSKLRISGLKLSVKGENLYTWTPYIGMDPERSGYAYPTQQGVSAGFSATF
jgi:hypothetical protein